MSIENKIRMFAATPGLMSVEDLQEVNEWMEGFNDQLNTFRSVFGDNAVMKFVDGQIEKVKWYIDFKEKNQ